ncbi:MAG: hypothetical protein IKQ47_06180 [Prevotella sp.]|jgi:hypothetical protein|nr:hypothetical protein [Prevotella sp.]MBQ8058761.1 hypothetical protein [Prevotella sp.]MBQ8115680.1 hypothetical protein [Prevotella sp.]MBR4269352.1 hypothetical protein [Prevotella sp.]MCI6860907.1 hypothetical protein [Prevotella sp.]
MTKDKNVLTLRALTKGNVWDLQENDIFTMWAKPEKDDAISEHGRHYMDIIKTAFEVEEIKVNKPEVIKKYEERGMCVGIIPLKDKEQKWAIKKRSINRITDLTYENIYHISAAKLLEVIEKNFGGGWDSLNQGIKDIVQSAFDISTTTLPKDRLRKPGGLYDIKTADGYEVLEIEKGNWTEAIFAKQKPKSVKPKVTYGGDNLKDDDMMDDADVDIKDDYYKEDEDDVMPDDDQLTEESYRTTIEEDADSLSLDAAEISDSDDDY